MNRLGLILCSVLTLSVAFKITAQADSIILLNGKVYRGNIISTSNQFRTLDYTFLDKQGQHDTSQITFDRIFSYTQLEKETVLYAPNEFTGDFLTISEARNATLGSYDARQTFKPRVVFYSSIVIGFGISLIDTYYPQKKYDEFVDENGGIPPTSATVGFFGIAPTLMPLLSPCVLSAVWGIPSFRIKEQQILQKRLYGDVNYYRGFHRVAKQRRVLSSLLGNAIGITAGMLSYYIFTPN